MALNEADVKAWMNDVASGNTHARLLGDEDAEKRRKQLLTEQAAKAGGFGDVSEYNTGTLGNESNAARQQLQDIASGKLSYSKEALRQGLQQNQAAQRSMAASASPQNAAMAARTAAMQSGKLGYGMSGQAALAGIAEQQGAMKLYQDATLAQRQQDMQAALQSRQTAVGGYGGNQQQLPEKTFMDKYGKAIEAGAIIAASDRRLKTNVSDADGEAASSLDRLKAYSYDYKDTKYGKGRQLGVMAQDLEKAGLGQAVIDTPEGKMVHGGKLAGANTAMLAAMHRRLSKLEGGK